MLKKVIQTTSIAALFVATLATTAFAALPENATSISVPGQTIQLEQKWDKIFPQSDKVDHRKVTFKNRYGFTLAGDLYAPKNAQGKLAAIAVSGPFGAVKEQSSGLYAQTLAERGFVTLAFDPSFTGESSGYPHNTASPDINTEDFSAAVDYLGSLDMVNRDEIGILGICGWGGFALNDAIQDTRVKAVATSTMYNMTRVMANGYEIKMDPKGQYDRVAPQSADARYKMKEQLNNARWESSKQDYAALAPANNLDPEKDITPETPKFIAEYADFYRTKRGYHPRSVNSNPNSSWANTTPLSFINMPIMEYAREMRTPALIVAGEKAHSRYFSEDAYKAIGSKDKELYIVPGANHTDLYDNVQKIPFDKFEQFFKEHLK
ncbi:alpha/beta hydrolase [Pectinatus haikarae]|uniref:alpha/beta hydrolase n=1 Tax=Pectinatus haikarae TaxID=349096 RepID=UPI001E5DC120|nr:alpha/beta hydrolase [Pectinatus haikarae]